MKTKSQDTAGILIDGEQETRHNHRHSRRLCRVDNQLT